MGQGPVLLGYFFGPRRRRPPTAQELSSLSADRAVLIGRFGDLALAKGEWTLCSEPGHWASREEWPMPFAYRTEEVTGRHLREQYDANEPSRLASCEVVEFAPASVVRSGVMGAGYVEEVLNRIL